MKNLNQKIDQFGTIYTRKIRCMITNKAKNHN